VDKPGVSGNEPKASRPHMTGYGVPESLEGTLPWEWARERISKSHNYWLTTVRGDGAPHTMVVWGIWLDASYYFSTSATSRKARNLQQNPNCVVCTENAEEAVILEGVARKLDDDKIPQQAFIDSKRNMVGSLIRRWDRFMRSAPRRCLPCPRSSSRRASLAGCSVNFAAFSIDN
jgi:nitroimidazol reductase NimA-like FMN-containing flavoprotein (pyridoxamine 5'-phosphate oxidase superfamily)